MKITNCDVTRSYRTGGICISCVSKLDARDLLVDETGYQGVGMIGEWLGSKCPVLVIP